MSQLIFLLLTVLIGYLASAAKLADERVTDALPQLLFNICYPAMILETFSSVDTGVLLGSGLPVAGATILLTLVLLFGSLWLFRKLPAEQRALLVFLSGVGNVTYVAIPLFQVFLSAEAVLAAILHGAAQDPLIWGVYHPILTSSRSREKLSVKKLLRNPCLLATLVGLMLVLTGWQLPEVLLSTLSRLSSLTSPLALLLIGMLVHRYGLFSWLKDRKALLFGTVRVILFPLVTVLVLLPFLPRETALWLAILFGSPTPLMAVAWSQRNRCQEAFTIHCFLFSTLLYLAVMVPLILVIG